MSNDTAAIIGMLAILALCLPPIAELMIEEEYVEWLMKLFKKGE